MPIENSIKQWHEHPDIPSLLQRMGGLEGTVTQMVQNNEERIKRHHDKFNEIGKKINDVIVLKGEISAHDARINTLAASHEELKKTVENNTKAMEGVQESLKDFSSLRDDFSSLKTSLTTLASVAEFSIKAVTACVVVCGFLLTVYKLGMN